MSNVLQFSILRGCGWARMREATTIPCISMLLTQILSSDSWYKLEWLKFTKSRIKTLYQILFKVILNRFIISRMRKVTTIPGISMLINESYDAALYMTVCLGKPWSRFHSCLKNVSIDFDSAVPISTIESSQVTSMPFEPKADMPWRYWFSV